MVAIVAGIVAGIGVAVGIEAGVTIVNGVEHGHEVVVVVVADAIEIERYSNSGSGSDAIGDAGSREYGVDAAVPQNGTEKRRYSYSGASLRCQRSRAGDAVVVRRFGILIWVSAARAHLH